MRFRLTLIIPALFVVFAIISSILVFSGILVSTESSIRLEAMSQLNRDMTRLQNILYNRLTENNLPDARLSLSVSAMDESVLSLVLVDEADQVLIANRYNWESAHASTVSGYDLNIANEVKAGNKPAMFFSENNDNILVGYFPVVLGIENAHGHAQKKTGVLFSENTLVDRLHAARSDVIENAITFAALMLVASLITGYLLHLLVSRRIARLTRASHDLASGDLDVRVPLQGNDELTILANAFNEMAERINEYIKHKEKAENELRDLNESLEKRIRERTALLADSQRLAHLGNWTWNMRTGEVFWSDEIYRIFGFKVGEIEPNYQRFISMIHPDDTELVNKLESQAIESGIKQSLDYRIILENGMVRWLREEIIAIASDGGDADLLKGIVQDITERKKEAEKHELLERQLMQTQKMESLGQLTGGIAHDFNNMLASIIGFTDLAAALDVDDKTGKLTTYLEIISQSSEKAKNLIAQMLAFSRSHVEVSALESISVKEFLTDMVKMLRPILPSSIKLNVVMPEDHFEIYANSVMLSQVFMNLCVNARDAMPKQQGEICINVQQYQLDEVSCASCHQLVSGEFIVISFQDNGSGINQNLFDHIFEPFFTTKEVGKGTGMGLSMMHGIMHKLEGHILLASELDKGTLFQLLFPVITEDKTKHNQQNTAAESQVLKGENKRILVVDDEVPITIYLKDFLIGHGFRVTVMHDGQSALDYYRKHIDLIDLVISDQTMPGISGLQMAQVMREINPQVKIILCSGYSEQTDKIDPAESNVDLYITKPIDIKRLSDALNELLS